MPSETEGAALDPRDERQRAALLDWLAFHRAWALQPQRAVVALRAPRDPVRAPRARPPRQPGLADLNAEPPGADPASDRLALARAGAVALPFGFPAYPESLAALDDPAPLLCVRGHAEVLSQRAVAIVGSRAATVYGRRIAREWAAEIAAAGWVVVSGLARGIDAQAHLGALDADGVTVAVLACGIDRVYPREHRRLAERIAERGAVISELPPGTPPRPPFFPLRNRLISGLARAVLVVEARPRSGSLITADHAGHQGRDVFAVPGPITAPTSAGPNELLRTGASVALGPGDVIGGPLAPGRPDPAPRLGADAAAALAALAEQPAPRDALAARLGVDASRLAVALLELELAGCVAEDRDGALRVVDLRG